MVLQLVHKSEDIGILPRNPVQLEQLIQAFAEQVERQLCQLLLVLDECLGQELLGRGGGNLKHAERLSEDIAVVVHHQVTFGDGVQLLIVVQHEEGGHQHLYGNRGFEQESLIADQLDLRCQLMEPLQEALGIVLLAHQYGKVLRGEPLLHHLADVADHIRYHVFLVVIGCRVATLGIEGYGGIAFVLLSEGQLLHIAIDILDMEACLWLYIVQRLGSLGEESIVEIDDILLAAEVVAQFLGFGRKVGEFLLNILQDGPVTVTPTVDALFDVAHEEIVAARRLVLD